LAREEGDEAARQGQDVLGSLAQGRHRHLHHVEAVEEVLAEAARLYPLFGPRLAERW
jgi:hypothetical protein